MRRRTGICAPAVGRGFAGMRCGAQGGRSVWAFRRRSRSKDSAGMRGRVWTHGLTCAAMDGVEGDALWRGGEPAPSAPSQAPRTPF